MNPPQELITDIEHILAIYRGMVNHILAIYRGLPPWSGIVLLGFAAHAALMTMIILPRRRRM